MARWQAAVSLAGDGSAGGDSAAGGGLATAALRSRFGGWRLGGRRLGGGGGLATAAPRSQLGVVLWFSLSFSLSRGLSVLIRGHIQDLCVKSFIAAAPPGGGLGTLLIIQFIPALIRAYPRS